EREVSGDLTGKIRRRGAAAELLDLLSAGGRDEGEHRSIDRLVERDLPVEEGLRLLDLRAVGRFRLGFSPLLKHQVALAIHPEDAMSAGRASRGPDRGLVI